MDGNDASITGWVHLRFNPNLERVRVQRSDAGMQLLRVIMRRVYGRDYLLISLSSPLQMGDMGQPGRERGIVGLRC